MRRRMRARMRACAAQSAASPAVGHSALQAARKSDKCKLRRASCEPGGPPCLHARPARRPPRRPSPGPNHKLRLARARRVLHAGPGVQLPRGLHRQVQRPEDAGDGRARDRALLRDQGHLCGGPHHRLLLDRAGRAPEAPAVSVPRAVPACAHVVHAPLARDRVTFCGAHAAVHGQAGPP